MQQLLQQSQTLEITMPSPQSPAQPYRFALVFALMLALVFAGWGASSASAQDPAASVECAAFTLALPHSFSPKRGEWIPATKENNTRRVPPGYQPVGALNTGSVSGSAVVACK